MIARLPSVRRLLVLLVLGTILVVPATAGASTFPDTIRLPDGWQPEGIASGRGTSLYVGSIPTGAVWKGDARTGQGDVLVPPRPGERNAIGIKVDKRNRLFVAGGPTGKAFVYDARTGEDLASYQLAAPGAATFVNDVVVTSKAAWFTDSRAAQLYALPLGRHGGLPDQDEVRTLPLTGDFAAPGGHQPQRHRRRQGRPGAAGGPDQHRQAVPDQPPHRRDPRGRPRRGHPGQRRRHAAGRAGAVRGPEPAQPDRRGQAVPVARPGPAGGHHHRPRPSTCRPRSPSRPAACTRSTPASAPPTRSPPATTSSRSASAEPGRTRAGRAAGGNRGRSRRILRR